VDPRFRGVQRCVKTGDQVAEGKGVAQVKKKVGHGKVGRQLDQEED